MKATSLRRALVAAALLSVAPAAIAQDDVKERVEDLSAQANEVQQDAQALANDVALSERAATTGEGGVNRAVDDRDDNDDDNGNWGLLGLLGLAGLLGLRRRDDRHVHADVRRDGRL